MICLVALITCGILGIFSARYRKFAKEAFHCVFRRVTLRPCQSGFDRKIKSKVTAKLLGKNPTAARFVYKNFEAISWLFTIALILSATYSVYTLYHLLIYETCPSDSGQCVVGIEKGCSVCAPCECTEKGCFNQCGEACTCEGMTCE